MKYHCITAVWGESYTSLFLDVALPNQLTKGNLGAFRPTSGSLYRIFTKPADAERIRQSPVFRRLQDFIEVDVVLISQIEVRRKHQALTQCHRQAIADADAANAVLVILSPDTVWSDGTFRKLMELIGSGKRAVMTAAIRIVKETFVPAFVRQYRSLDKQSAAIASRDLVKLALQHIHPYSKSLFWDSPETNFSPSHFYWNVSDEGMILRCFHLHPLAVNPQIRGQSVNITVDHDYFSRACPNLSDTYIVEDSDELVGFELSAISDTSTQTILKNSSLSKDREQRYNVVDVANLVKSYTTPFHRAFFERTIRFHHQNFFQQTFSPRWKEVQQASDRVVSEILFALRCLDKNTNALPIYASLKTAVPLEENTLLAQGVNNLLVSPDHSFVSDGGYDYVSHLQLGLKEGLDSLCTPSLPEVLLAQARKELQFPNNKPIVILSPLNDTLALSLPLEPILTFMQQHSGDYNFVVVGPCKESSQFSGVHAYWSWEYVAFLEKIKLMSNVRTEISDNIFFTLALSQCADYFVSSYNRLATVVSEQPKIPSLIIAPLFAEYASGHTAGGKRTFINCDLQWGLTTRNFNRFFQNLTEGTFGNILEQPYTSLCEGLESQQYLKKLLWYRICSLVFQCEQGPNDVITTALEWEGSPFEHPLREKIHWDEVYEGLTILWDLQAEIFKNDINAVLLYSLILANAGEFQRGEVVLETALKTFVGNPFITNNLAVCKWNNAKTEEALVLSEALFIRYGAYETIRGNCATMRGRKSQGLEVFPFKVSAGIN